MAAEKASVYTSNKFMGLAVLAGLGLGSLLHVYELQTWINFIRPFGEIFLRLLFMLVVPLIISTLYMSIVNIGEVRRLGLLASVGMGQILFSTGIAVFFGLVVVELLRPRGFYQALNTDVFNFEVLTQSIPFAKFSAYEDGGVISSFAEFFIRMIPTNPLSAVVEFNILQVIFITLLLGILSLVRPVEARPLVGLMESIEKLSLTCTSWVMRVAPIGVFALVCEVMASTGLDGLKPMIHYASSVGLALAIHAFFLLFVACTLLRRSPLFILGSCAEALMTAFSTASSAATMPVTAKCAEENLGLSKVSTRFMVPFGATLNMDGTAIYTAIATVFIANTYGIELGLAALVTIFATSILVSLSTAAIPSAGLISLGLVLNEVGVPLEGMALILAIDRMVDMLRTTLNVFSDLVATAVVDSVVKWRKI